MNKKIINTCIAATLSGLSSVSAQAATISLSPTSATINIGESATFKVFADAADVGGLLAGGLDMFYDLSMLRYNGDFAFAPLFPTESFASRLGDDCAITPTANCSGPGEINGIAFGSFANVLATSGPALVGSLSFTAMAAGTSFVTMADNYLPAGGWFSSASVDLTGLVVYEGATVNAVPVPAAAWLFGAGLIGLAGIVRRKSA